MSLARSRFVEGAKAVSPILLGAVPFGLIVGVTIVGTDINNWVGWSTSWLVFGGASQLVLIELLNSDALVGVAIAQRWPLNSAN